MMTRRDALKLAAVVPFALPEIIKGEKEIVQVRVQRRPTIFVVVGPPKTGKLTMALCAASQVGAGPRSAAVVDARWWTANWEPSKDTLMLNLVVDELWVVLHPLPALCLDDMASAKWQRAVPDGLLARADYVLTVQGFAFELFNFETMRGPDHSKRHWHCRMLVNRHGHTGPFTFFSDGHYETETMWTDRRESLNYLLGNGKKGG